MERERVVLSPQRKGVGLHLPAAASVPQDSHLISVPLEEMIGALRLRPVRLGGLPTKEYGT